MLSLILLAAIAIPQAQTPTPTPTPTPAVLAPAPDPGKEDPAITALALKIYSQMRAGKVDEALMTDTMNKGLNPETLAKSKPVFDQLGDPTKLTFERLTVTPEGTRHDYLANFPMAQLHVYILITKEGKVGGYFLKP